jgi:signal transduction histidine kinase
MPGTKPGHARPPAGADTAVRNYPLLLRRLERLMEVGHDLASTLDLPRLLRQIIDAARELTGTEAASIMLFDPRSGELRFEATTNIESAEFEGLAVPLEGSIAGWIVQHGEPVVVPDTRSDPRWHQAVDTRTDFVTRSILGVPLVARGKTLGVLEAINKSSGIFTDDDVATLVWLAAQASAAIVNARLFEQSDLISELVHELRTPLTALMATSQLLARPDFPADKRRELVTTLQRETRRLSDMATSFLDISRLESGRMRFSLERFDLAGLVEECRDVVRPQAAQHGIEIGLNVAPNLPALESDRGKIKQVLLNLLTNAIKYNAERGQVSVTAAPDPAGVRLSVSDTGRGIPPEAMPHLFERYYRVPDTEGFAAGTGLGLRIARSIVEALGGEMRVTSEVGRGSTFSFVLPLVARKR